MNRMRSTLGWSERDIVGMVEGFARLASVHFSSPTRGSAADRALTIGTPVSVGDSDLAKALRDLADAVVHRRRRTDAATARGCCRGGVDDAGVPRESVLRTCARSHGALRGPRQVPREEHHRAQQQGRRSGGRISRQRSPVRSGGEQQVEPADGEADHRRQEGQLAGELVLLGQQLDRPLVGGDDPDDVTGDDGQDLPCSPGTSGGTTASRGNDEAPVPKDVAAVAQRVARLASVCVPIATKKDR